MDSVYEYQDFNLHVFQPPNISPEPQDPAPLSVQLELTIALELSLNRHDCSIGYLSVREPFFFQETRRFDLHLLSQPDRIDEIVASMLRRLEVIRPSSFLFEAVPYEVIRQGAQLLNCTSSMGRLVLPLHANIRVAAVEHVNPDACGLLARAVAESELARRNYGMVPAKESSVKEMVKRSVSIKDDQDCAICLEGFEVGSVASELPCFHAFHDNCIEKWLKLSHYCPICRFELPTDSGGTEMDTWDMLEWTIL